MFGGIRKGSKSLRDYGCLAFLSIIILAPRTANAISSYKCALSYLFFFETPSNHLSSWVLLTADSDGDIYTDLNPASVKE